MHLLFSIPKTPVQVFILSQLRFFQVSPLQFIHGLRLIFLDYSAICTLGTLQPIDYAFAKARKDLQDRASVCPPLSSPISPLYGLWVSGNEVLGNTQTCFHAALYPCLVLSHEFFLQELLSLLSLLQHPILPWGPAQIPHPSRNPSWNIPVFFLSPLTFPDPLSVTLPWLITFSFSLCQHRTFLIGLWTSWVNGSTLP